MQPPTVHYWTRTVMIFTKRETWHWPFNVGVLLPTQQQLLMVFAATLIIILTLQLKKIHFLEKNSSPCASLITMVPATETMLFWITNRLLKWLTTIHRYAVCLPPKVSCLRSTTVIAVYVTERPNWHRVWLWVRICIIITGSITIIWKKIYRYTKLRIL